MRLDPELISILRCPTTRQPLVVADDSELMAFGALVEKSGRFTSADGVLDGILVRQDRSALYPVCSGIPMLRPIDAVLLPSDNRT